MVPRPLPAASIEQTVGQTFTFYGYQFEVPWTEVKREEHLKSINQLKLLTREGTENEAVLKRILGEEVTRSNYMLRSKILNLTPSDLHLSLSRQKMVSSSVPLMLKPMWTGNLQGGLYSFQTEWLQGFQRGDPTRDKTVTIDAFDAHDHEIELSIGRAPDARQDVTQSELNRIVYSLRPIFASRTE
jgi:hypothetical protein